MTNIIDFHKKPRIYNQTDVMNHLNEPYKVEFEKDGKNYFIVEKDTRITDNYHLIGMMTGVDVLTGGEYEGASYIDDVSDLSTNELAKFVLKHNLEGIMDWGADLPNFPILFCDQLFNAHDEIENPMITAEGMPKGLHCKEYSKKTNEE